MFTKFSFENSNLNCHNKVFQLIKVYLILIIIYVTLVNKSKHHLFIAQNTFSAIQFNVLYAHIHKHKYAL